MAAPRCRHRLGYYWRVQVLGQRRKALPGKRRELVGNRTVEKKPGKASGSVTKIRSTVPFAKPTPPGLLIPTRDKIIRRKETPIHGMISA